MPTLRIVTAQGPEALEFAVGASLADIVRATPCRVSVPCGGRGRCGGCRVRVLSGAVGNLTDAERRHLPSEQIEAGVRLACQLVPLGDLSVEILDAAVAWRELAEDEYAPVALRPVPSVSSAGLGIAVDLGTTQIRVTVWDLAARRRLGGCSGPNPQSAFGSNVLDRLEAAAGSGADAAVLGRIARQAIGDAIGELTRREGLERSAIVSVAIVGNTAMLALLTEHGSAELLQPDNWSSEIEFRGGQPDAWAREWGLPTGTRIEVVRPLAGFVGSDLLAGVLATGMTETADASLLVDLGTNSEIAVWDGAALWVTSTPGGPAFEECGTGFTMPAEPGAVYRATRREADQHFTCDVIGGGAPRGLCGSALIDVVAALVREKRLLKTGNFASHDADEGVAIVEHRPELVLRKHEVDALQRAKAAIGAGITCLLGVAGVAPARLGHVHVCGAFGRFLDVVNAQEIGLLPQDVPAEAFRLWGDTALAGCELLVMEVGASRTIDRIREDSRPVNLAFAEGFDDLFVESLYLEPLKVRGVSQGGVR